MVNLKAPASQRKPDHQDITPTREQRSLFLAGIKPEHRWEPGDGDYSIGKSNEGKIEFTREEVEKVTDEALSNAKISRVVNTDELRPLIPGYTEAKRKGLPRRG